MTTRIRHLPFITRIYGQNPTLHQNSNYKHLYNSVVLLFGGEKTSIYLEDTMAEFELYKDRAGEWRWRFRANNGKIIADSGEGYKNKQDCEHGIELIKEQTPDANIEEI